MTPDVSVLLPYRDASATVGEALASMLDQRGVRLEVIAIDDGSRDDGPARVARVAGADARVVCGASGGAGIVAALGAAVRLARAPLLARMDADDISLPSRLARQLEALAADAALGAVGAQVQPFPEGQVGEGLRRYVDWQNAIVTADDHTRELFVESPLCHPTVVLRRSAFEQVGAYRDSPWAEDYDLFLRLAAAGHRLAKVPEVLLRWRNEEGRLTFRDPRYSIARFLAAKAHYLAPELARRGRPVAVWGAGPTGRRLARGLASAGVRPALFIDIDPRKLGRTAQGAPIEPPEALTRGAHTVVVAVGARGARELVRERLVGKSFEEGVDFICAA